MKPQIVEGAAGRRNRDAEVLEAAVQVFYRKGYAASTVQDVADVVGVLKGSLYHYISSKEELLLRILEESHEQAQAIMEWVSSTDAGPMDRLRAYLTEMCLWYLANIERVSIYFNQQQYLTGQNQAAVRTKARLMIDFIRDLLVEAQTDGSIDQDVDVKLAALFVMGALNSLPSWYRPTGTYPSDQIARQFVEMSVASVRPCNR